VIIGEVFPFLRRLNRDGVWVDGEGFVIFESGECVEELGVMKEVDSMLVYEFCSLDALNNDVETFGIKYPFSFWISSFRFILNFGFFIKLISRFFSNILFSKIYVKSFL